MSERKWYKGDTHLHTTNSDGILSQAELIQKCKDIGLDFMIITDHNFNTLEESYYDGDMLVIQGQEITGDNGHVNIWGAKVPQEPPYALGSEEEYNKIIDECRAAGATVSLNHPYCSQCGFRIDLDKLYCDCVEVWNTIQHTDNMVNRDWWVKHLLNGERLAAVGGSDFHKEYVPHVQLLLASPTTIVLAEEKTPEAILKAMREGRSVITNSPNSTMIELTCGDAVIGDTVEFKPGTEVSVTVTKLKAHHTVTVYNNEKPIYTYKTGARSYKAYSFTCEVREKGFVRVEITYEYKGALKKLYKTVESKFLNCGREMVPFIRAFTNPIWFE